MNTAESAEPLDGRASTASTPTRATCPINHLRRTMTRRYSCRRWGTRAVRPAAGRSFDRICALRVAELGEQRAGLGLDVRELLRRQLLTPAADRGVAEPVHRPVGRSHVRAEELRE